MANPGSPAVADDTPLRYYAALPWIGPIVGAVPSDCDDPSRFRLAGAVDPALMRAFAAAFIPVIEKGKKFVPADRNGVRTSVKEVAWLQSADRDHDGWFRITPRIDHWQGEIAGVLVVLLYNESRELLVYEFADAFGQVPEIPLTDQPAEIIASATKAVRSWSPSIPVPDASLVKRMVKGVIEALEALLEKKNALQLRPGLSEIHRPSVAERGITFAVASCQYPSGLLEGKVATASYERLSKRLDRKMEAERPQCLLLVGDQIYVDGTAGLFDPTAGFDRFVRPYEILHRLDAVRDITRRLPTYMLLDDHEIADNWEPRFDDVRPDPIMLEGRRSYLKFERAAGPKPERPTGDSTDPMWYRYSVNGFPFFMADTRTERRTRSVEDVERPRIMSKAQFTILRRWLQEQDPGRPKFVASPAMLLPRHLRAIQHGAPVSALRADGWDGYPGSMYPLLAWIGANEIRNVVFLSGDEHLACVARVTITPQTGRPVVVHSVHSSPLFAPFPFANSVREDLVAKETFDFEADVPGQGMKRFECAVDTTFADAGDGFAVLRVARKSESGRWILSCAFDRDPELVPNPVQLDYEL
jgi:cholesterol oxidase